MELGSETHQQQVMMQPQYLQDISKTSRTLGMLEEQQFNETVGGSPNKIQVRNAVPTGTNKGGQGYANSVIRKPPRIHRRNKGKRLAPYFQRKHRIAQRRIIQKPWSRPMAAQHLAAIKIQGAIRRFLYRQRRRHGMGGVLTGVYAQW